MDTRLSALSELRAATQDAHLELEQRLRIARPDGGRAAYLAYLAAFYGWLAPFEARLWEAPWPAELDAASRAGKRLWIEEDLKAAGWSTAAIDGLAVSPYQPPLASLPERFGIAYVIEGSQLGAQVLRKSLAPQLGDWSPRWLQSYGPQTAQKWKTFISCAEAQLTTLATRQEAAQAARGAFIALSAWFDAQGAT